MKKISTYFNKMTLLLILGCIAALASCKDDENGDDNTDVPDITNTSTPNILLIIADDMGKDATNGFSEGSIKPFTPHIDEFKNTGLSFNNFWAYPTCSPTRSSIITGKYGYRTGVKWAGGILDPSETTLQKHIRDNTGDKYATAIVGKWHLSGGNAQTNPETFGIDYYAGLIRGTAQSYTNWLLTENGSGALESAYATTKFTDLAIDWLGNQDKPWFMWLAYNAPHTPFHAPQSEMHQQGDLPPFVDGMDEMPYYMAAIEAMDYQIGRLLDSIPDEERANTIIIFIGDNGSPNEVAQSPYGSGKAKGTLYQGGENTPLFVSGKGVSRSGDDDNLITSSDLFATISELVGVSTPEIHDSKSFHSLLSQHSTIRNFQYSEMDNGNNDRWTISDGVYKLLENANGNKELYDLVNDPYEDTDLLDGTLTNEASTALNKLETELSAIRN